VKLQFTLFCALCASFYETHTVW